jgi:DNA-binding SARP family transcriptional activator/alpha-beta hydrolase superfamily lysophospholipase
MAKLSLTTLGFPAIHFESAVIKLALRKAVALLVYLAEARGPVSRETLAALLWPEMPADAARARLRRTLNRIRTAFGEDVLQTDRTSIQWVSGLSVHVDAHEFELGCDRRRFGEVVHLYRGDFLAGFSIAGCAELEEWAFFRREALRGRLVQALEHLVQNQNAEGNHLAAAASASRLASLDPLNELFARHLIRSYLLAGDRTAAQRQYAALRQRLHEELGVSPEAETRALLEQSHISPGESTPRTQYVRSGSLHLAFQVIGEGPIDILLVPGFVSHVERSWQEPRHRAFVAELAQIARVILFDRRGTGLSDRIGFAPSVDATAEDIGAILQGVGSRRSVLFGASEGGPACVKFAAEHSTRLRGLILFGAMAKGSWAEDYPFALSRPQYALWLQRLIREWGGPAEIDIFAPTLSADPQARAWWAGLLRTASSPGAITDVLAALRDTDVRALLPRISIPTLVMHRRGDRAVRVAAGRDLAGRIPSARFVELAGDDHWYWAGDQQSVLAEMRVLIHGLLTR